MCMPVSLQVLHCPFSIQQACLLHLRAGCPGAAAFLEALPGFAKPAPPTPMADIMAGMDADFHDIPTKLMSAVNKPGSPCKARADMQRMMHLACVSPHACGRLCYV